MRATRKTRGQEPIAHDEAPADEHALLRKVIRLTRVWRFCEAHVCRRAHDCVAPGMPCEPRHRADFLWWQREVCLPFLRKRFPTVQWGAVASVSGPQLKAALAAEANPVKKPRGARRKRRRGPAGSRRPSPALP